MDDDELLSIASKLDSLSDASAAQSQLSTGQPFLWLTANRDALIQFAVVFLRAAASQIPVDECRAKPTIIEHNQICNAKTDYILGAVQRIDKFPDDPAVIARRRHNAWVNDSAGLLGCAIIAFLLLFLLMPGISYWWNLLTGTPLQ